MQLEKIAERLNEKTTKLQEEIKEKEKRTSGALFETDDPEKMQHRVSSPTEHVQLINSTFSAL